MLSYSTYLLYIYVYKSPYSVIYRNSIVQRDCVLFLYVILQKKKSIAVRTGLKLYFLYRKIIFMHKLNIIKAVALVFFMVTVKWLKIHS